MAEFSVTGYARPDLSTVESLMQSNDYQVWINGEEQFVYKSIKRTNHGTNNINSMSFLNFGIRDATTLKVKPKKTVKSFEIRPYSANVAGVFDSKNNMISFNIDKPQKLVVVVNNSYDPVLIISADPPHTPPAPDSVEYYFGPGIRVEAALRPR